MQRGKEPAVDDHVVAERPIVFKRVSTFEQTPGGIGVRFRFRWSLR